MEVLTGHFSGELLRLLSRQSLQRTAVQCTWATRSPSTMSSRQMLHDRQGWGWLEEEEQEGWGSSVMVPVSVRVPVLVLLLTWSTSRRSKKSSRRLHPP